jgi:hypothetical protein
MLALVRRRKGIVELREILLLGVEVLDRVVAEVLEQRLQSLIGRTVFDRVGKSVDQLKKLLVLLIDLGDIDAVALVPYQWLHRAYLPRVLIKLSPRNREVGKRKIRPDERGSLRDP